MSTITESMILERLAKVKGPDLKGDLVSLGLVGSVLIDGGKVMLSIEVPQARAVELEPMRIAAEQSVVKLDGVTKVTAVLTAEVPRGQGAAASQGEAQPRPEVQPRPEAQPRPEVQPRPEAQPPKRAPSGGAGPKAGVPGIKHILAVASGKGGVGKSTTSVNLALALQAEGQSVGILDADIYGPSMPRLLGLTDKPSANGRVLSPLEGFGLKVMSMGFLVDEETPMIWRGPMVISALTQMLREVAWGELDVLVVDMPPGTGDAQLTMAQQVPLAGAVIVSTPQDIALVDARKGLNMFRKVEVPILGIVENMSTFVCPHCGETSEIFGHGGARQEAERLGVPFLGEVPLHIDIRTTSDGGTPITSAEPESIHAKTYRAIARKVLERLSEEGAAHSPPDIVFE